MGIDQTHRPGPLKQTNKKHKTGRHLSKGRLAVANKGRVNVVKQSRKKKLDLNREERRNQSIQSRKKKREEYLERKRGISEAPFLIAVIPLEESINGKRIVDIFVKADEDASFTETPEGHIHLNVPRWRQRYTFVILDGENLFDTLDALKVASSVLFLTSPNFHLTTDTEAMLTSCVAQGMPTSTILITDFCSVPIKKRQELKNQIQDDLSRWIPEGEKVMSLEKDSDALTVLRKIANQKLKLLHFRECRPHLVAEKVNFIETDVGKGRLSVCGYLHGATLDVNSLVHLPGWGDFQISSIDSGPCYSELMHYASADPSLQTSLDSENTPDPMDAEQTWPTKEDFEDAKKAVKKVKKVPKGFSDYQAAWIPDEDAFEISDKSASDNDMDMDEAASNESDDSSVYEDAESIMDDTETISSEIPPDRYDTTIDKDEEKDTLEKLKKAKEDADFPDEVDTPLDVPAKVRFQKYRGLLSFRTTPWNPKENLPQDYARIFQFKNFERTKKTVLKSLDSMEVNGPLPGSYIRIHIEQVPTYLFKYKEAGQPLVVFGMLPHEQKMSLLNILLKYSHEAEQTPIESKDSLLFQCGYRRFKAMPIFSQHTTGNKFKYMRFFQPGSRVVASTFAPIIFPPSSVLAFKENLDATMSLVATGNVLSADPNRMVIKRTVLSGHLYKVNKKSAVVRFMFFNRDDILWFKPVELRTKYGRRGHIKEPLGTHGHMKCVFNGPLKSQDTVLMYLYKRIYPKWTYNPFVSFTKVIEGEEDTMETAEATSKQ